jgi:hypothetical protein
MSVNIFLSTVSDEFRRYRDLLRTDLTRHNVEVKVQEDFRDLGGETLDKFDVYIGHCDAVVHLVGDMTGAYPGERELSALLAKYPDLPTKLAPLSAALKDGVGISYTQWEAGLALFHGKLLLIATAAETAEREPQYPPTDASRTVQYAHLARLILGMAKKVADDRNLDFEGKKQAVRNAIDIYQREISGSPTQTNIDAIVDEALARARSLVDAGKSASAQAALRRRRRPCVARRRNAANNMSWE